MRRSTKTAPVGPALCNQIRQISSPHTALLESQKGHALGDQLSATRMATGVTNRCWKIDPYSERRLIGIATRSQLKVLRTPREIFDAPGQISDALCQKSISTGPGSALSAIRHAPRGESWYSYCGLPGARWERESHGR